MTEVAIENMQEEIKSLKNEVEFLKRQITNFEIMTPEEETIIEKAIKAVDSGSTKTLDEIEQARGD